MQKPDLRLGIVADEIDRDFAKAVRIGQRAGLRHYEVRFLLTGRAPMCDVAELYAVEKICQAEGMEVTALSPGLFKWTADASEFSREMREVYPRAAEWARRWNLPGLIVFGFHKPGATEENGHLISSDHPPAEIVDWLAEAAERAAADHLTLLIEPEHVCWADTAAAVVSLIGRVKAENLRINYDPGNLAWGGRRDTIDDLPAMAPWIANMHVKDLHWPGDPNRRPEFVPPGEGIIAYAAHFRGLQAAGYRGPISLEPHMDGSEATIRRCKAAVEQLW